MPQTHTHEHTRLTRYLHIHVLHAKSSHVSQLHVPTRWWLEAHSFVSWPARCKDGSLSLVCCFSHLDSYMHIHAHTCTYMHIHAHTCTYVHIHAHTCTYMHIRSYIHIRIDKHTRTHAHTHTRILYIYIYINNVHTYTYTHTRAHTHTHIYIYWLESVENTFCFRCVTLGSVNAWVQYACTVCCVQTLHQPVVASSSLHGRWHVGFIKLRFFLKHARICTTRTCTHPRWLRDPVQYHKHHNINIVNLYQGLQQIYVDSGAQLVLFSCSTGWVGSPRESSHQVRRLEGGMKTGWSSELGNKRIPEDTTG